MKELDTSIKFIKGVGDKRAILFSKLGIFTVYDLLTFYPRTYEDWSNVKKIADTVNGEEVCVRATCINPVNKFISKKSGITVYSTAVSDGDDIMNITIFNNRFAAEKIKYSEEYLFFGKVESNFTEYKMTNPSIANSFSSDVLKPIYPQTASLNSNIISKTVKSALPYIEFFQEPFPQGLIDAYNLIDEKTAIKNIHFPESDEMLKKAQERLVFEELLYLQLGLIGIKNSTKASFSPMISVDYSAEFEKLLPFQLTNAQKRVIAECTQDLKGKTPMSRLVQGDVGSGKTAVAMSIMYSMAKNSFQCAMMAPTEILAEQHYESIKSFFSDKGISVALLSGASTAKEKKETKALLREGKIDIIIGTQALIQGDVEFASLGLVIADEQHRFGVKQRTALTKKGENANLLIMSATPIPRTLALFMYGELDISIIDELPKGRQKIDTLLVDSSYHERIYSFIKDELDKGRQAYVVCPLVEENESELLSAEKYSEELRSKIFSKYEVGLLHGKMKGSEKDNIMQRFKSEKIQLLVSTTVIEVGIDVPNATIMLIENADRYGLSQLHQLRGRIGRGSHKSYCILVSDNKSDTSHQRLEVMKNTSDGFVIANEDLKLRGPGDFFGEKQHGIVNLKIANLVKDMDILKKSGEAARTILQADPQLKSHKYSGLKNGVNQFFSSQKVAIN